MIIATKSAIEIAGMRDACHIVRDVLLFVQEKIHVGMTTKFLDSIIRDFIERHGATPSFLNYRGFPASACISIDDEVVHGIPSDRRYIEDGQLVSVDVGAYYKGFHGDAARTFCVGSVSEDKRKLTEVTEKCFFEAFAILKEGVRLGDIGAAVYAHATKHGYGVVRELVGHGIGRNMHEPPDIPNFGVKGRGLRLPANSTVAIEPMINMGTHRVRFLQDGWTVKTEDGMPSAHYENTVLITKDGAEILTR